MNRAPDGTPSLLSPDDYSYIRNTEFKERFGDCEKAWRLEKAKRAPNIENINFGFHFAFIQAIRTQNDITTMRKLHKFISPLIRGNYFNQDTQKIINLSKRGIDKICSHDVLTKGAFEALTAIPHIIQNAVFITESINTKKDKKPDINKYLYFLSGLEINSNLYTIKSVVGYGKNEIKYYDQKVFEIEKSHLIELIENQKRKSLSDSVMTYDSSRLSEISPFFFNDKRLYEICQCPQAKFLDKNFEPKKEIIDAVRKGKTLDDLLHTPQRKEPSRSILDQFLKDKGPDAPSRCVSPPQKEITNPKNNGFEL